MFVLSVSLVSIIILLNNNFNYHRSCFFGLDFIYANYARDVCIIKIRYIF